MTRALFAVLIVTAAGSLGAALLPQPFSLPGKPKGPVQPINYSHELHAGKLGMNCLYCHYGAEKSPIANLPPVSTCMGCHKIAASDRPEVQKLAGYYERGEQVPWVEVYQLPDHVKFNHKRHVKAGIQCFDCHGRVDQMPVVYQAAPMKMGWCVDCHRKDMANPRNPDRPASLDCLVCHH
jgi:hypothetical protein